MTEANTACNNLKLKLFASEMFIRDTFTLYYFKSHVKYVTASLSIKKRNLCDYFILGFYLSSSGKSMLI